MPKSLRLQDLSVSYPGRRWVLRDVSLEAAAGDLVAVIGPSGSGKSTLLKVIAGLVAADAGDVLVEGESLAGMSPADRPTAMVFQTDTLFPDLSVRQNIAFGLTARRTPASDLDEMVDVALLRFGLVTVQDRLPHELSGGQQRRAALARALVLRPEILLLDEPLAGLDDTLRTQHAVMVRDTQRRFGITTIYVTHHQEEALFLPDKLVVLNEGRVEQVGTPREVYTRPRSVFAASFIGRANLLDVEVETIDSDGATVTIFGEQIRVPAHPEMTGREGTLVVRPEIMTIVPHRGARSWTEVGGRVGLVSEVWYFGSRCDYLIETESGMVTVATDAECPIEIGSGALVGFDPDRAWLLPAR